MLLRPLCLALVLLSGLLSGLLPPASAQTAVQDSVRMTILPYYFESITPNDDGSPVFYNCGSGLYATWPDVLDDILDRPTSYSDYARVATEGQFVPFGLGELESAPEFNITVPEGSYGHNPQLATGAQSASGFVPECSSVYYPRTLSLLSGAQTVLNGRPFRITEWYAVFDVPDGTPVALFDWEQGRGLTVDFDGFAPDLSLSREIDAAVPGNKVPVVSYAWAFGDPDNSMGAGPAPSFAYEEPGSYLVTLTVTDDDGDVDSYEEVVTVREHRLSVTAAIEEREGGEGDTLRFVATIENVGTAPVFDIVVRPDFGTIATFPDSIIAAGYTRFDPTFTPTEETVEPTTRASLGPGASFQVERTYEVTRVGRYRPAGSQATEIETEVLAVLASVSGKTDTGEAVRPVDACFVPPGTAQRQASGLGAQQCGAPTTINVGSITVTTPGELDALFAVGETYTVEWDAKNVQNVVIEASTTVPADPETFTIQLTPQPIPASPGVWAWEVKTNVTSPTLRLRVRSAENASVVGFSPQIRARDTTRMTRVDTDDGQKTYAYFEPSAHGWSFDNTDANWFPPAAWFDQDSLRYQPNVSPGEGFDPNYLRAVNQTVQYNPLVFSLIEKERPTLIVPEQRHPAWPTVAHAFRNAVAYQSMEPRVVGPLSLLGFEGGLVNAPRGSAFSWWEKTSSRFKGVCYGMALSTMASFWDTETVAGLLRATYEDLSEVSALTPYTRGQVNALQLYQIDGLTQDGADPVLPSQAVGFYRDRFADDERAEDSILGIYSGKADGTLDGGHAVVPYRLTDQGNGVYALHLYDPNFSRSNDRVLTLDTITETYTYSSNSIRYGSPCPLSNCGLVLLGDNPSINRVAVPQFRYYRLPFSDEVPPEQGGAGLFAQTRGTAYTLTASDGSAIRYADSTAAVGIDGAEARFELNGTVTAPYGYRLPAGAYTLAFDDTAPGDGVLLRRGNEYLGFTVSDVEGDGATAGGQARPAAGAFALDLADSGAFTVRANPEQAETPVTLETLALMTDEEERSFRLGNLALAGGAEITTELSADSTALRIEAPDATTAYRLTLTHSTTAQYGLFFYDGIVLEGGAVHTLRPPWGTISTEPVVLEIDADGNGTVDETRQLANQVAVTNDPDDPTEVLPETFALVAYPNPAVGMTTVEIALPEATDVRTEVLDLLGRRVALLHDGPLAAATHALRFDATRVPSGLYVVRAVTSDATLTRSLVVVR